MVLVAVAFVVGGVLGAVLTAALIARAQRALSLGPSDLDLPVRPADQWAGERDASQPYSSGERDASQPYSSDERIERFEQELAKRLGREAAATARERRAAAYRALRPAFGISIRVRE
ncbi:MAG TPA: hypothetical protein VHM30_19880 [Gemmatimonadaceae bacterium]|nr:hypothetical protein [Gemmatimonadaceae bacterium]